jgi:hypothetical protein
MPLAPELEVNAAVDEALALQSLGDPELVQEIDDALLEHAGADTVLDVVAVARLEHDALDACDLEQAGQREPGGPGADDADLGLQLPSSSSTRWKT